MTEQRYKIERRAAAGDEMSVWVPWISPRHSCTGVLVPVPTPHTLAWAMGEMVSNPMREYHRHPTSIEKMRWNGIRQCIEQYLGGTNKDGAEVWDAEIIIDDEDMASTTWAPCEENAPEKAAPARDESFAAHLQHARRTVNQWPAWKQAILGGTATELLPDTKQDSIISLLLDRVAKLERLSGDTADRLDKADKYLLSLILAMREVHRG